MGSHTSPRRSGKADHGSRGFLAQRLCLGGAGGLTLGCGRRQRAGRRAWQAGFRRRRGFFGRRASHGRKALRRTIQLLKGFFGRRAAHGRAQAGQKAAHAGASGYPGLCAHRASGRAAGAFSGPSRGFSRGAPGKNRAAPGQNGAFGRPSGAGTAGVRGKKAPFCREKGGQRGCAGAKQKAFCRFPREPV